MKYQLFLVCLLALCVACTKPSKPIDVRESSLEQFRQSGAFKEILIRNKLLDAQLSEGKSYTLNYKNDPNKQFLFFTFEKEGNVYAQLRIILIPKNKVSILGKEYLSSLLRYNNYDNETNTGTIQIIDTDRNDAIIGSFNLINGRVVKDNFNAEGSNYREQHYCDKNKNGDVTYSECMTCMIQSCFTTVECGGQCILYQAVAGACLVAFEASCGVISFFN